MGAPGTSFRRRWFSRRALLIHLALLVWVPGCGVAAWWQVGVAMSGDHLGWVYAVEWPVFGVLGTIGWWQAIHDDPETVGQRGLRRARAALVAAGAAASPSAEGDALVSADAGAPSDADARAAVPAGSSRAPAPQRRDGARGGGDLADDGGAGPEERSGARDGGGEDEELAAYNAYLASLAAARRPKTWRDPLGVGRR